MRARAGMMRFRERVKWRASGARAKIPVACGQSSISLSSKPLDEEVNNTAGGSASRLNHPSQPHHGCKSRESGWRVYRKICQRSQEDRKSTRLNSSHVEISYAVVCLK